MSPITSPITSPAQIAASLTEYGSPRAIAELNGSTIQVAKLLGAQAWRSHAEADVLFMVLKGYLRIEMETGVAELIEGEMFVVPKGVRHHPVAEEECQVLLVERQPTLPAGDVATDNPYCATCPG